MLACNRTNVYSSALLVLCCTLINETRDTEFAVTTTYNPPRGRSELIRKHISTYALAHADSELMNLFAYKCLDLGNTE